MSKYIKLFENHSQYEEYLGGGEMILPNVSHCIDVNDVHYNPISKNYFTIESLENDNTISFDAQIGVSYSSGLLFSTDNGNTWTPSESNFSIPLAKNEKIIMYNENESGSVFGRKISSTKQFKVYGDISYLLNKEADASNVSNYAFMSMFENAVGLIDAEKLILSPKYLSYGCYARMFSGCTSLVTAPQINGETQSGPSCYRMFYNCTSLQNAPQLPMTNVSHANNDNKIGNYYGSVMFGCYTGMFDGCTSLVNAPQLHVTELVADCYAFMFRNCTSLQNAPELLATDISIGYRCCQRMFDGCTSLVAAPELVATTLADGCYKEMFYGCTNLQYIKMLANNIPYGATDALDNWVSGVSSEGTFVKNSAATFITIGVNGIPEGWTVEEATE